MTLMTRDRGEKQMIRWAVKWSQRNALDGYYEHFMNQGCLPLLFNTRKEARDYITRDWGYLKSRPDLRRESHGWHFPKAVRVKIKLTELR